MYYGDIIQIRYVCRRKKGPRYSLIHERKHQRIREKKQCAMLKRERRLCSYLELTRTNLSCHANSCFIPLRHIERGISSFQFRFTELRRVAYYCRVTGLHERSAT